jgi:uncharacterized membrane protein YphA (DoxX/SURF4 family)
MTHAPLNFLWMPGRVLFVSYFIALGLSHLIHFEQHALVLKRKEVPLPRCATLLTIVMMISGGVMVLFDWQTRIGALILFCIIFPAPFFLHRFWNETDSYMRLSEFAHLMKDLSLAGAALIVAAIT